MARSKKKVEYFRCWDDGRWDTGFLYLPEAVILEHGMERAIDKAVWENIPKGIVLWGFYAECDGEAN